MIHRGGAERKSIAALFDVTATVGVGWMRLIDAERLTPTVLQLIILSATTRNGGGRTGFLTGGHLRM